MCNFISTFFEAWQFEDVNEREKRVISSVTNDIQYDDPRTTETIEGVDALCEYIGMFSKNAPGWSAKVLKSDTTGGVTRATVAFSGAGPDGTDKVQYGQYFVEKKGNLISRMVGFVGTGEPE